MNIFHRAMRIIRKDGVKELFPKIYNRLVFDIKNIVLSFYYTVYIKMFPPSGDIRFLMEFAFKGCGGFIKPAQIPEEISEFMSLVYERKPDIVIEIGTALGGTLFLLARTASEDAKIISIDMPEGRFGGGYPVWKTPLYKSFAMSHQKMYLIRRDSHKIETVKRVENLLCGIKVGLLFIDGDHTYEGVKKDFELYSPLVDKGGIIALHDIVVHPPETNCEVNRFWEEVKNGHRYDEIIADKNQTGCGIGVIYVD